MRRFRAAVGVMLAAVATFLVSCSSGPAAVAPTYTPEKLAQLQTYVGRIEASRDRLPELLKYIEKDNWVNVDNFTHGPLGRLRPQLSLLSNQLLPADQKKAKQLSEEILAHLENLDEASQNRSYGNAVTQYREFVSDFDALLGIVPEGARVPKKTEIYNEVTSSGAGNVTRADESRRFGSGFRDAVEDAVDGLDDRFDDARDAVEDAVDNFDN